jgi:hypothetical protein
MLVSRRIRGRMGPPSVSDAGRITSYSLSRMMKKEFKKKCCGP